MGLAIKSALEEGSAEFVLLHGDEAYKFHWAKKRRRLGRLRGFPSGALGRLSCRASVVRDAVRGLLRKLPSHVLRRGLAATAGGGSDVAPAR